MTFILVPTLEIARPDQGHKLSGVGGVAGNDEHSSSSLFDRLVALRGVGFISGLARAGAPTQAFKRSTASGDMPSGLKSLRVTTAGSLTKPSAIAHHG
ncbi:MAG: hypothetical protein R3B74_16685 [Nitrospirales bacterium]|nr:hypothetical protein [Nitrospirales bacterium]